MEDIEKKKEGDKEKKKGDGEKEEKYVFTDGVGTISKELGSRIWEALCKDRQNMSNLLEPSAYQIRFLGSVTFK